MAELDKNKSLPLLDLDETIPVILDIDVNLNLQNEEFFAVKEHAWRIDYNGFNIEQLEQHLRISQPELLESQSLYDMSMPFLPLDNHEDFFDTNYYPQAYYPIAIHWWHDFDPGVKSGMLQDNIFSECIEIRDDILEKIVNNQCKILLYNSYEGFPESTWQFVINSIQRKYWHTCELHNRHFVVSSNNVALERINSIPFANNQLFDQSCSYYGTHTEMFRALSDKIMFRESRPHKAVCLLRRPREDRWAIMTEFFDIKAKGDMLLSFSMDIDTFQLPAGAPPLDMAYFQKMHKIMLTDPNSIEGHYQFQKKYPKSYEKFRKGFIHKCVPFWIANDVNPKTNPKTDDEIWKFQDSYLHIVSETYFDKPVIHFSEKIFKPIWYLQPFVVFSTPHTLKHLRESLGFHTFGEWIDESYDSIEDYEKRMYAAVKAARDFMSQDTEKLDTVMIEMLDTLHKNYWQLQENRESLSNNFVGSLREYSIKKNWDEEDHGT